MNKDILIDFSSSIVQFFIFIYLTTNLIVVIRCQATPTFENNHACKPQGRDGTFTETKTCLKS